MGQKNTALAKLGIVLDKPIGTKDFNRIWAKYADADSTITRKQALKFIKDFTITLGGKYNKESAVELLNSVDPSGSTKKLTKEDFTTLFLQSADAKNIELTQSLAPGWKKDDGEPEPTLVNDEKVVLDEDEEELLENKFVVIDKALIPPFNIYSWYLKRSKDNFPTYWKAPKKYPITVSPSGRVTTQKKEGVERFTIQADKPFTITEDSTDEFYYEITITTCNVDDVIAFGIAHKNYPDDQHPGWHPNSWAFHSDDGGFFCENGQISQDWQNKYGTGCFVGCGIRSRKLYFTLNGFEKDTTVTLPPGEYYPTIGLAGSVSFGTNFGSSAFNFPLKCFMEYARSTDIKFQFTVANRFNTYISTDKPIYKPGEIIYWRAWLLHVHSFKPLQTEIAGKIFGKNPKAGKLRFIDPSGSAKEFDIDLPKEGVLGGAVQTVDSVPGGDYILSISYNVDGLPPSTRKINIRKFTPPKLKMQLEFPKKGYGPSDQVVATLEVSRAEGGIPDGASITTVARIDGEEVFSGSGKVPSDGKYTVTFTLPSDIQKGEGTLTCTIQDGGVVESVGQTIPILLQSVACTFYPEGGDLVVGLPCGVYGEAFTPTGDPADISGHIVDDLGRVAGVFQTMHEGRGRGIFTPLPSRTYSLKIFQPTGIKTPVPLPTPISRGISLRNLRDCYNYDDDLEFLVSSSDPTFLSVIISKRDVEVTRVQVRMNFGERRIVIPISSTTNTTTITTTTTTSTTTSPTTTSLTTVATGVLRVTVESNGVPVAERLIFRKPRATLQLSVTTDKESYCPKDNVRIDIKATTELGLPVNAITGICVTDDSVLEMVEKRRQVPRITPMVLLEDDVDHLEDSHVYLDSANLNSALALDLLLGTQGWRRFAFSDPMKFISKAENSELDIERIERVLGIHKADEEKTASEQVTSSVSKSLKIKKMNFKKKSDKKDVKSPREDKAAHKEKDISSISKKKMKRTTTSETLEVESPRSVSSETSIPVVSASISLFDIVPADRPPIESSSMSALPVSSARRTKERERAPMRLKIKQGKKKIEKDLDDEIKRDDSDEETDEEKSSEITHVYTRIYAHNKPLGTTRSDFTETLYWDAGRRLNKMVKTPVIEGGKQSVGIRWDVNTANFWDIDVTGDSIKGSYSSWLTVLSDNEISVDGRWKFRVDSYWSTSFMVGLSAKNPEMNPNSYLGAYPNQWGYQPVSGSISHESTGITPISTLSPIKPGSDIEIIYQKKSISVSVNGKEVEIFNNVSTKEKLYPAISFFVGKVQITTLSFTNPLERRKKPALDDLSFFLSDSVTSFKVWVEAVTDDGMFGQKCIVINSKKAFNLDFKLPIEVSAGDKVTVPVSLVNETGSTLSVNLANDTDRRDLLMWKNSPAPLSLSSPSRTRVNIESEISRVVNYDCEANVTITGTAGHYSDSAQRKTSIVCRGFPHNIYSSGILQDAGAGLVFRLPEGAIPGSIQVRVTLQVRVAASLTEAFKSMIREPSGCFEQVSATAHPMIFAQQYFLIKPSPLLENIVVQARRHIESAYNKLLAYEIKEGSTLTGGYNYFGQKPASQAMTAYGLVEFFDMSKVFSGMNPELISRVREFLLNRRNGTGGFSSGSTAYKFGYAPAEVEAAYILWALSLSGTSAAEIEREVQHILKIGNSTKEDDPYFIGLVANTLLNLEYPGGSDWATRLVYMQRDDGSVGGNKAIGRSDDFTTICKGYGKSPVIEATAFAILAWLKAGAEFQPNVAKAIAYLRSQCNNGDFGATQTTVMALRAIIEDAKMSNETDVTSKVAQVTLNDAVVGKVELSSKVTYVDIPVDVSSIQSNTEYNLRVMCQSSTAPVPYTIYLSYYCTKPDNHPDCAVRLSTKLASTKLKEGDGSEIALEIQNVDTVRGIPMVIARIGLPGGLEPRHAQLQELVKQSRITFYEVRSREIDIYLQEMNPGQKVSLKIDVVARIPGSYTGAASSVYLYYTPEQKFWVDPLEVSIEPATS